MFKKIFNSTVLISFFLSVSSAHSDVLDLKEDQKISIENLLTQKVITLKDIPSLVIKNNLELKSLKELINASSYNLSSKISKRYPSLDITANGLPQYLYGKNYKSSNNDTKTSQIKVNPTLNLRWDLIDPQRGLDISSARNNFEIAKNNYEIKKNDLIQEAKLRYHKFQKSYENTKNAQTAVDLSNLSLKDANSKLDTGIGTKFEVLEANAQLARDIQFLNENKIEQEIDKISLKEILNLDLKKEFTLDNQQSIEGYWHYSLSDNIENGINNSYSLANINLQSLIKKNQSKRFSNANLPKIYISNNLSSSFTKGSTLSTSIDPKESNSSYTNTISLNFSWMLFNGGQNKNSSKAKRSEFESEKYKLLDLQNSIKKNISETYLNLLKNQEKLLSTRKEINASKEALRLSRLRYDVGISTLKDVLIRQKELTNARAKKINTIFSYNTNLDKLERLTFLQRSIKCMKNSPNSIDNKINTLCDY